MGSINGTICIQIRKTKTKRNQQTSFSTGFSHFKQLILGCLASRFTLLILYPGLTFNPGHSLTATLLQQVNQPIICLSQLMFFAPIWFDETLLTCFGWIFQHSDTEAWSYFSTTQTQIIPHGYGVASRDRTFAVLQFH